MSVYTQPSLEDVQALLKQCDLPKAIQMQPIKGGIENSNFFLTLDDSRVVVLTLFEELNTQQASFLAPLMQRLTEGGVKVALPFADRKGNRLHQLSGKPAQIALRLSGAHPQYPSPQVCYAMGESLALMHVALKDYEVKRQHAHGENWWLAVANHWKEKLPVPDKVLLETVLQRYRECALNTLPQGLIHGDLFLDNVLFEDERVSGILDFSECGQDFWLLDIAITSNDFCRQWPSDKPDAKRLQRFLHGYSRIRPLSTIEQNALPVFQAVAAMRFWLSRLDVQARNQAEGRMGEHVLEKDPNEMRELLRGFLG